LNFGFETIKENGGIGWFYVGEKDAYLNGKIYQKTEFDKFDYILHQTRNPLDVVRTLPVGGHPMWQYVQELCGYLPSNGELHKHLWFWTEWNKKCELLSQMTYKVEDLPHIGSTKTNSKKQRIRVLEKPTWKEVKKLYPPAFHLAKKYKYI
jgi:hypothetical protein